MTVETAPRAAEPARAWMVGGKGDRLKAGGGQGPGGGAANFAGLLSLSATADDLVEPATDAAADTIQTAPQADNSPMDLTAMLALLIGVPASAMASMKSAAGQVDTFASEPAALGAIGNPAGTTSAALLAGGKVDWQEGGRAGGVSEPMPTSLLVVSHSDALVDAGELNLADIEQNRFELHSSASPNGAKVVPRSSGAAGVKSAAGRAETFAPEPAALGAIGNPAGTTSAALLAGGKVDWQEGGRAGGVSEPMPTSLLVVSHSDALVDAGELNLADIEQNRFELHSSASPNGAKVVPRSSGAAGVKSAAGRAETFASEPAASGKVGAAPLVVPPGVDGVQAAGVMSLANGNQTGAALAALLVSGKGDGYVGGRPSDAASEPAPPNMLAVTAAMLDGSGRSPGGNSDKAPELAGKPGLESANPGASLGTDGVGSTTAVAEMPSLQISDTMLADTVSYWVSQGVQNAELTLDGWGGEAIQVSIQLSNGEALIGFRSDLAETRQLIEGAMDQLKDLLASQGLSLAGVSVGTSSRQDGNPGETPRRAAGRLRGISLAEATTAQPAPRANGAVGQRLDLFV